MNSEDRRIGAKEIDFLAANWVQRRRFWDWADEDQAQLEKWLSESLAHRAAYLRLDAVWDRTGRLAAIKPSAPARGFGGGRLIFHIAAGAALFAILVGAIAWFKPETAEQRYVTSVGGRESIILSDGSQIELNTDSVIRVGSSANQRTVWLDRGEAYFQVRHNAQRPFVVFSDRSRITDLGTKFIARRDGNYLRVSLVEGSARLDGPQNKLAVLQPGDVAVTSPVSLTVLKKPVRKLEEDLGWRNGVLTFNRTTLADAVAEFNRYNRTKLVIADQSASKRRIYGTFPTTDTQAFTRVVKAIFGVNVVLREDKSTASQ